MKWDSLPDLSDRLFRRVIDDKDRPEEDARLEDIARRMSDDDYLSRRIAEQEQFDYMKAYRRGVAPGRSVSLKRYVGAAAIALILLTAGMALWFGRLKSGAEEYADIHFIDIRPGTQKALLITHSGEEIELNGEAGLITEQDGTTIQVDGGVIHYQTAMPDHAQVICNNTLIVPRGGEFMLTLSDGSRVWLNSESRLVYPVKFGGGTREVSISGEAYFEVAHNAATPFVVRTGMGDITVIGTEFNVCNYPENGQAVTTLVSGKIAYDLSDGKRMVLAPGQQLTVDGGGNADIRTVDTRYATSWKEGMFLFQEKRLEDILEQAERWYDFHVIYTNETVRGLHFTGDLSRSRSINTFIEMFESSSDVRIEIQGKMLIVGM